MLVVDDSAFMRRALAQILEAAGDIEVVGTARDGEEGVAKALELQPDVVTLDVNMPQMDGLTALCHIVDRTRARVVMVSSLTQEGAEVTLEALALGAVDFVAKPGGTVSLGIKNLAEEIVYKVRAAARARVRGRPAARPDATAARQKPAAPAGLPGLEWLAVIGVSTGGPRTLEEVLIRLSPRLPLGVVVVQHMPPHFTLSFAQRLDRVCAVKVEEASEGAKVEAGKVIVARGGYHLHLRESGGGLRCHLSHRPEGTLFKPSVEVTMRSAMEAFSPQRMIGILLTGMGDDGAEAMAELRRRGGFTIAESEETAVVWGMPRAALERGGAEVVVPCYEIPAILERKVKRK